MSNVLLDPKVARALSNAVDKLGALNAVIAGLQSQAEAIKAKLKASGLDVIEGRDFKAVVSVRDTARLDTAEVRKYLTPAQITACTKVSRSVSVSLYDK